ncbi:MAG: hypothetical protein IKF29_00580 [Oceanobacillus sp.]|nr:hypothetical protein [Oceanobacillus sp.]
MNKCLYTIQDILEDELKKISKQEALSSSDIEDTYKMVDILKDIATIEAMEKSNFDGYSGTYSEDWPRYAYDNNGGYSGRNRNSMGRYSGRGSSYDGYSGHSKEDMIEHLRESMMNARSDEDRESFRRAIEQLNR